jgi:hypothetical protein
MHTALCRIDIGAHASPPVMPKSRYQPVLTDEQVQALSIKRITKLDPLVGLSYAMFKVPDDDKQHFSYDRVSKFVETTSLAKQPLLLKEVSNEARRNLAVQREKVARQARAEWTDTVRLAHTAVEEAFKRLVRVAGSVVRTWWCEIVLRWLQ